MAKVKILSNFMHVLTYEACALKFFEFCKKHYWTNIIIVFTILFISVQGRDLQWFVGTVLQGATLNDKRMYQQVLSKWRKNQDQLEVFFFSECLEVIILLVETTSHSYDNKCSWRGKEPERSSRH